jgi:hypothetical protein
MGVRAWLVSGTLAAILLAGCGSSSPKTTSSALAPAKSASHVPPGAPPALRGVHGRVLLAGELSGFKPTGHRALGINASSWATEDGVPANQRAQEATRLTGLGFLDGVSEHLQPTNGGAAEGLSIVEQFRTPDAAHKELAFQVKAGGGTGAKTFAVAAIPGARGFGGSSSESSGINVAFTKGAYYYLVGVGWPSGTSSPPTRAALIAAALHLYDRVQA